VKPRILIVDDEPAILDTIQYALEAEGLATVRLSTGQPVVSLLASEPVDLVVLDIGLPDVSGLELLKEIRRLGTTPVVLLTARTGEIDRVLGLEIGADDYVSKPFSPRELVARVKAVLRRVRSSPPRPQPGASAVFELDRSKRRISYHGQVLELSKYEYEILATFLGAPGHVFSREQLMRRIWEQPETSLERAVDAHVKNLRAKLRAVRPDEDPIVTHRGAGYALRDDP
jgi:two-component system, OmpR family, catabolic regulation response regulator CreB